MEDDEVTCDQAFRRWCAEELVDPRLRDVLEEAFVNGWLAKTFQTDARTMATRLRRVALRRQTP